MLNAVNAFFTLDLTLTVWLLLLLEVIIDDGIGVVVGMGELKVVEVEL